MVANLTCVANSDISTDKTTDLFNFICGSKGNPCAGISADGAKGVYGAYSMCSAGQRLSYAMNSYFEMQGGSSNSQACDFSGNATTTSPSVQSTCTSLLQEAGGPAGTGVVTSHPTNTDPGLSGSTSSGAASAVSIPAFDFGVLAVSVYATFVALAGAGIFLL